MRILVLVKEAPDTYGERALDLETGLTVRVPSASILDEPSARALESALVLAADHPGSTVGVVGVGPESAMAALRTCLAMGANAATLVSDPLLVGADLTLTAVVLEAVLRRTGHDLILAGEASTDGATGALPAMLSELLDYPLLAAVDSLVIDGETVVAHRTGSDAAVTVRADFPAIASVGERMPDPRMPGIKGILAAKKAEIPVVSAADLDLDEAAILLHPRSIMISVAASPARTAGTRIVDDGDGDGGRAIAAFIRERGLA